MTPRSLANARVRLALVALMAGGSLLAIERLRPADPGVFPPALRTDDPAAVRDLVRGQEGRDPLSSGLRLDGRVLLAGTRPEP